MLPAFLLTGSGNRTTFFNDVAWSTCWEQTPFYYGPMVFKYSEVLPRLTNPRQRRGFYAATVPESTNFFGRKVLIFLDGEDHAAGRLLLEKAGFARRYPVNVREVRSITATGDSEASIVDATVPTLMYGLWGQAPSGDVLEAMRTYASYGKFAIFGARIDEVLSPAGITQKVLQARQTMSNWAAGTPFTQVLLSARDTFLAGNPSMSDDMGLVRDITDAAAFAGLLGTTDLVHKCVLSQRNARLRDLFWAHPERFLVELMRLDSAVTSVTELLQQDEVVVLEGRRITLARGTPAQLVLASANRDPVHFARPNEFDPNRPDLADTLAWNGRVQDVEARDLERAPRHCPGYCLSIKIGAAVCAKLTGSFEELLSEGKVGGEIRCNNFEHAAGKGDTAPLWQPSANERHPVPHERNYSLGAVLVRPDSWCRSEFLYISKFPDVARCTEAVEGAGGKYFSFGKGLFQSGWCYLHYTTSSDCPDGGFRSGHYDFYDIAAVPNSRWLRCRASEVNFTALSAVTGARRGALLDKQLYSEPQVETLADVVEKRRRLTGLWYCRTEHRLACLGVNARIEKWEACCRAGFFRSSCTVPSREQLASLSNSELPWTLNWNGNDVSFDVPALALPAQVVKPQLIVELASRTVTLREVFNGCPVWVKRAIQAFARFNAASYRYFYHYIPYGARDHPLARLLGKTPESSIMDPSVFGTYTMGMVVSVVHLLLKSYSGRPLPPVDRITLPRSVALSNRFAVYSFIGTPTMDIDNDTKAELGTSEGCVFDAFRSLDLVDDLDSGVNEWWRITGSDFENQPHQCPNGLPRCTKKQFILGVFANYTTQDGDPVYPAQQIDFAGLFHLASGAWVDEAERFLAFGNLGMHRVEVAENAPSQGGETAAFVVATLDIAGLPIRQGFAVPGADMFFSREGQPLMVRTPEGSEVWRHLSDAQTWQYWKFAWRSSLFLKVTLIDHLYATHYAVGGMMAAASREALPPMHPLRRLLTIFTWNTIKVNNDAMHQLIGSRALLQRSTPFHDWLLVINAAQAGVPSLKKRFGAFLDRGLLSSLPAMPYYEDGQLLFNALHDLSGNWTSLYSDEWCGPGGVVKDPYIQFFFKRLESWSLTLYNLPEDEPWLGLRAANGKVTCSGMRKWLSLMFFGVTGYHRQVGQVADVASDPDFASFSWRDGDRHGMPRQHLQMALIAATTAKIMPKIDRDYSFVAGGLHRETEAIRLLADFQLAMARNKQEVERRNRLRSYPYYQMDPKFVECSVGV